MCKICSPLKNNPHERLGHVTVNPSVILADKTERVKNKHGGIWGQSLPMTQRRGSGLLSGTISSETGSLLLARVNARVNDNHEASVLGAHESNRHTEIGPRRRDSPE